MIVNSILAPLLFLAKILLVSAQNPLVITKYGPVIGKSYQTTNGAVVTEFLGIPFATPPIGNHRYEKPSPPIPWTTPINASMYQPACVPCVKENLVYSEDCLYLNIWTPSLNVFSSLFPVVFYIHAGGYLDGSGRMNNEEIREMYAQNGILFISIQYRLGFFGFLTLNETRLPPNLGLWDQNLALRWVQDNVGRFGGDSKRVTIWGTSAGSSSVGQHIISPKSQGLFAQAFQQSGSSISNYARGRYNIQTTLDLLSKLGCSTDGNIKSCLRSKSIDDFYSVIGSCHASDFTVFELSPMLDGDFFIEEPEEAILHAPPIPTLVGLNEKEGRLFTLQASLPFSITPGSYELMTSESFFNAINQWVTEKGFGDQAEEAARDIYYFYAQNNTNSSDNYFWIEQYTKLFTDFFFNVPCVREISLKVKAKYPIYAFVLDYFNEQTWPVDRPCQGSTHLSEFPYCLGLSQTFQPIPDDYTVSALMQQFIIQFIRTGSPSSPSLQWNPITAESLQYLSLRPKPSMAKGLFSDSHDFWSNTMRKYNYDYITRRNWT